MAGSESDKKNRQGSDMLRLIEVVRVKREAAASRGGDEVRHALPETAESSRQSHWSQRDALTTLGTQVMSIGSLLAYRFLQGP